MLIYIFPTARDRKRQRRHTNYKAQKLVIIKVLKSTEYTVFNRIYPARSNIIFVEGNKFIASFETQNLFLSLVLKNYREPRSSGASRSEANCWGASCFEPVVARHCRHYRKINVLRGSHAVRLGYQWSELQSKPVLIQPRVRCAKIS